jgi:hypothetical protein
MAELPQHPSKMNWGEPPYQRFRQAYAQIEEAAEALNEENASVLANLAVEVAKFCDSKGVEMGIRVESVEVEGTSGVEGVSLEWLLPEHVKNDPAIQEGIAEISARYSKVPDNYAERLSEIVSLQCAYDEAARKMLVMGRIGRGQGGIAAIISGDDDSQLLLPDAHGVVQQSAVNYATSRLVEMVQEGSLRQVLPEGATRLYYALDLTGVLTGEDMLGCLNRAYPFDILFCTSSPEPEDPVERFTSKMADPLMEN